MPAIDGPTKIYIVQRLARFVRPVDIQKELAAQGIKVSAAQLSIYNPDRASSRQISKLLKEVFAKARADALKDAASVPAAHQAYRLNKIQQQIDLNEERGNSAMVLSALEQAAKEMGNAFTNKREHTGAGGLPLAITHDFTGRKAEPAQPMPDKDAPA